MVASLQPFGAVFEFESAEPWLTLRHHLIQRRAYDNWRANGSPSGGALRDWLDAEQEVDASARHQSVQRRAYENWWSSGCPSATEIQDWLEAEKEIDLESRFDRNRAWCI